jgi:hypothetical protein
MNDERPNPACRKFPNALRWMQMRFGLSTELLTGPSHRRLRAQFGERFAIAHYLFLVTPLAMLALMGCSAITPITPAQAVQLMNNPTRADARREGIAALVTRWDFGKRPPYPAIYERIAQNDSDVTVRAMAIRALNICRDTNAAKIFIAGLQSDDEQIRLECAKALANVPDPKAIPSLLQCLTGTRLVFSPDGRDVAVQESKDVRIAAADALRQYRNQTDVERSLIEYLSSPDFAVAWQCRQSLIALTGQDLKYDEAAWLKYITKG